MKWFDYVSFMDNDAVTQLVFVLFLILFSEVTMVEHLWTASGDDRSTKYDLDSSWVPGCYGS